MKMRDVPYLDSKTDLLKTHELVEVNFLSMLYDFEKTYEGVMSQDINPEAPDAELAALTLHLSTMKSDLLTAFCYGCVSATDTQSKFRKEFSLPKKVMDKILTKKNSIVGADGNPLG